MAQNDTAAIPEPTLSTAGIEDALHRAASAWAIENYGEDVQVGASVAILAFKRAGEDGFSIMTCGTGDIDTTEVLVDAARDQVRNVRADVERAGAAE